MNVSDLQDALAAILASKGDLDIHVQAGEGEVKLIEMITYTSDGLVILSPLEE